VDGRFYVDARGTVTGETPDAQRSLGQAQGRYTWQPTSKDLLVFLRTPPEGAPAATPRVVLAGDAAGFPLSDLIAFLSQSRWNGTVRAHTPGGERAIFLNEGEVRGAASDDPSDRLGEVIVRLGYASRAQLEHVMADQPPSKVGRALVDRGVLQAHDLWKCISHQVSEIFHALVLAREGSFVLLDQPYDEKSGANVRIPAQSLLMDSIRKVDEMAHFRKRIPHGRMYVSPKRAADQDLEDEERAVLAQVDGQRTVLEIAQTTKLSEFDATKAIFRLLEGGYVGVSDHRNAGPAPVVVAPTAEPVAAPSVNLDEEAAKIIRVFNFIFRQVYSETKKAGEVHAIDFLNQANAALSGESLTHATLLWGLSFGDDGSLNEPRVLTHFQQQSDALGSDPIATLRRAMSDVMFFLLFQAGEVLDPKADEDLNRRVKDLLATLGTP
jgi:hypothetical protein